MSGHFPQTWTFLRIGMNLNAFRYVVHVMSKMALEEVARARERGVRVIGEPLCTGLAKDQSEMWDPDFDRAAM